MWGMAKVRVRKREVTYMREAMHVRWCMCEMACVQDSMHVRQCMCEMVCKGDSEGQGQGGGEGQ